jgi:pyruvate dehydrogenase E1 component beta subunit
VAGTVAETIRELTRGHLEEGNGLLLGENISAVGWVNGTVPDTRNIVELPMTDVAGAGFAVGAALVGRRPIFVIRFQDFLALNGSPLINYAAKLKDLHGRSAPILVRAISTEGLGPVHSGALHGIFMHYPGFRVVCPMTPLEYRRIWAEFMAHDDPMIVSEHRESFANAEELPDRTPPGAQVALYAFSSPRFALDRAAALLAEQGITAACVHMVGLKPLELGPRELEPLAAARCGLVVDNSFEICGAARSIAYDLAMASGRPVGALGLQDRTKCLVEPYRNAAPGAEAIAAAACSMVTCGRPR